MSQFLGVYPISGEDLTALPVRAIGPAVAFYETVLTFTVEANDERTATLSREGARIGLICDPGHKPGEAGSLAIAVNDLDAMLRELDGRALDLSPIRFDTWNGKRFRVFFLRESENGYCFCFNQQL